MAKKNTTKQIEQYEHSQDQRTNIPHVGLVTPASDPDTGVKKKYAYDPHLDPQLQWAGKAEHTSFEVPTVSLHVHERIDPKTIIESVKKQQDDGGQLSLFSEKKPLREAIDFYKHKEGWSNRLIAGDSLLVMNSLLEKEGMAGKVQMVYFDPPYGIKYGSNFQPFVNKRDVKDGKEEDLTAEPEMIKAFRDTWELGIHSYLTYLRDRLLLAREMLHESGSVFVQISDENVHHVREILDEVFGKNNFISNIAFKTKLPLGSTYIGGCYDHLVWYAKDNSKTKFNRLWLNRNIENNSEMNFVELLNGQRRKLTLEEKNNLKLLPENAKVFQRMVLSSAGKTESCVFPFEFEGETFNPIANRSWKTNLQGMINLREKKRLFKLGSSLYYVLYYDDFPVMELSNLWSDTTGGFTESKKYVVQTGPKAIQRALLMSTNPGDIVLDITCGSGTTAQVAEEWGRRWITCDTSRVAATLAKQRLMTANFDYYKLAQPQEGVGSGFQYKTVPHITLGQIANNKPPATETLYDQPFIDTTKTRITGPFTVEAVPAPYAKSLDELEGSTDSPQAIDADTSIARSGETNRQAEWRDELLKSGVRAKGGNLLEFTRVEPLAGARYIQAEAETKPTESSANGDATPKKVLVVFGPEHAPLEQRRVENAWQEARSLKPDMLLFCAFQFDEEAAKDIDELTPELAGMQLLKAQMNADMLTDDLRKKRSSNESFWLVGQPDVEVYGYEFLVFKDKVIGSYDIFKELSGLNSLAEINSLSSKDLLLYLILSQGRDVWHYLANEAGWNFHSGKHSRGTSEAKLQGVQAISLDSSGFVGRVRDFYHHLGEFGISEPAQLKAIAERLLGNKEITLQLEKIAENLKLPTNNSKLKTNNLKLQTNNSKLSTKNYTQVEVLGFDYYNPKTGNVESGGKHNIAMWMLDTDYDNRSLFPSQVFFPMAGKGDGWDKLAKNLKAEIDEEKIEAYQGTLSLPFEAGSAVAVKIIDDRGIESLRVLKV